MRGSAARFFCCASLFFPLLCAVACKKQETGKKSLFNVALVHALFVLCFILLHFASACSLPFPSSFAFPRLIGGIWLRFLATQTQTANLEELPCGAAVCMAPMWGERAC